MDTGETYDELLPLLLRICEDFFIDTSPSARRELDALLRSRDITGGPGWLIDMLALTRQRLETTAEPGGSSIRQTVNSHESGARTHRH